MRPEARFALRAASIAAVLFALRWAVLTSSGVRMPVLEGVVWALPAVAILSGAISDDRRNLIYAGVLAGFVLLFEILWDVTGADLMDPDSGTMEAVTVTVVHIIRTGVPLAAVVAFVGDDVGILWGRPAKKKSRPKKARS